MLMIHDLKVNVEKMGSGETSIILLHGWGQSTKSFKNVAEHLSQYMTVFNIDLPGFGLSDKPNRPFNTEDYAYVLKRVIDHHHLESPILIGHSFGGRVAIKYTSLFSNVKKLVLVDSAGIVPKRKIGYYARVYYYKFLKRLFSLPLLSKYKQRILGKFGSTDFKNSSDIMRKILVTVVNEDLREDMEKINCPTLLVWGTDDEVTPISDAYLMKAKIKDSGIVKIENAGHFSYLENLGLFLSVLDVFFNEDQERNGGCV